MTSIGGTAPRAPSRTNDAPARTFGNVLRAHAVPLPAAAAVVVLGMALSLLGGSIFGHSGAWVSPDDIWGTLRAAHMVGWGGEGAIYQQHTGYLSFPGLPVLLAPVAMLSGALHLSESLPLYLPHPTAWLLLGPVEMALGTVVLFPLDAVARRFGVPRARRTGVVWAAAALIWPVVAVWGHPEDLLAVAFSLYALLAAFDERWTRSAVLLAVALAFQPLAVLVVPIVLARLPWRQWLRCAAIVVAPSALLLVAPLAHAWRTTLHTLVDQPTFPTTGHPTPWVALAPLIARARTIHAATEAMGRAAAGRAAPLPSRAVEVVAGGPGRLIAIACVLALAVVIARRRPSEHAVLWLAALGLSLRCVFESVMFPYYVVPGLLLALVAASVAGRWRLMGAVGFAVACTWIAYWHAPRWDYYFAVVVTLLGAWVAGVPRRAFAQQRAGDPAGGGVAFGSNGSRSAPHCASAGVPAFFADGAGDVGPGSVATVRITGAGAGVCVDAAELPVPHPAASAPAPTAAIAAATRRRRRPGPVTGPGPVTECLVIPTSPPSER